jgi:hypothetical protein
MYREGVMLLELKSESGRLSPDQVALHDRLALTGFSVQVARSVDEGQRKILEFISSRRAGKAQ